MEHAAAGIVPLDEVKGDLEDGAAVEEEYAMCGEHESAFLDFGVGSEVRWGKVRKSCEPEV